MSSVVPYIVGIWMLVGGPGIGKTYICGMESKEESCHKKPSSRVNSLGVGRSLFLDKATSPTESVIFVATTNE